MKTTALVISLPELSVPALQRGGVDMTRPFLVWCDPAARRVFVRQEPAGSPEDERAPFADAGTFTGQER